MRIASAVAAVAVSLAAFAAVRASGVAAPAAAPSPAAPASPAASPAAGPSPDGRLPHRAIVGGCGGSAAFYSWPDRSVEPARANYPAARDGDAFDVLGEPVATLGGMLLYETAIPVFRPYGAGARYYVAERCVTA